MEMLRLKRGPYPVIKLSPSFNHAILGWFRKKMIGLVKCDIEQKVPG